MLEDDTQKSIFNSSVLYLINTNKGVFQPGNI